MNGLVADSLEVGAPEVGTKPAAWDYARSPFIVIWEVTRACALACVHCRASATPRRDPRELRTEEGCTLIDEVGRFGPPLPLLVFTGGDPLRRPDISDLVRHASARGFRASLTPSGTAAVRAEKLQRLKEAGLARLAVGLDGSTAEIHDAFRQVRGSYRWTLRILEAAREIGLPLQINTTVTRYNVNDLKGVADLVEAAGVVLWSVFFLVPTGRGRVEDEITAEEYERVLNDLYDLSLRVPFDIKATKAPHYRRVQMERRRGIRHDGRPASVPPPTSPPRFPTPSGEGIGRAPRAVNDGNGFVFIDHLGQVYPSGFLPLSAGNVRTESLVEIYRGHHLFVSLRDPERLKGKCGWCEYREVCGGSRARAYALTGDPLESDPFCAYQPSVPQTLWSKSSSTM